MNIVIDDEDIQRIAEKVTELLTPRINIHEPVDEIFDKKGLAEYLGVDISWIDKNLHRITHFKLGKYVRFRRSHIDRWIENVKKTPSPYLKMMR